MAASNQVTRKSSESLVLFLSGKFFHAAYRLSVSRPGIEPRPLAVNVQGPNHWSTRELPQGILRGLFSPFSSDFALEVTRKTGREGNSIRRMSPLGSLGKGLGEGAALGPCSTSGTHS